MINFDALKNPGFYNLDCMDDLQIGKAGEYLVCADLILRGFVAYPSEQGLPYDIVLDTGQKLLRVQVKTTRGLRKTPQRKTDTHNYVFDLSKHGKGRKKHYVAADADIFALVTLDTGAIGYVKPTDYALTITLRADALRGTYYDEKGVKDYEKAKELHKTISNISEVARMMGKSVSHVNKMLQPNYKPFVTNAKYFSDIIRPNEWFLEV